ncbi:hypothetical protein MVEN_01433100 [Mycena venus]|uniref:DUF6534 domain-containing protein n=1 Tax=Mycena venus TaxID=2733690 RepID=A0A8H6XYJ0_9AGAR|nr:hypothetical protein MVEN_01433100 [Mycena venus]
MGEFDQTIGFTLMAVIINTYLTGVIMSQFFSYWYSTYQDPWWTRILVAFLFVINATQAGSVVYMSWFYCVTNFTNPQVFAITLWPYSFSALTTTVLAITNQLFQSWRIYQFTRDKILVGFLVATSLGACGTGVTSALESWVSSELAELLVLRPIIEANLALQCAVDMIIAVRVCMIFSGSKTSVASTDRVLNTLIRNAVQSGSFTAAFAFGAMLSCRFSPRTYMLALFSVPIGRIYTHTMMDQLISRGELRNMLMNNGKPFTFPDISVPNFNIENDNASNRNRPNSTDSTAMMLPTTSLGEKHNETSAEPSSTGITVERRTSIRADC